MYTYTQTHTHTRIYIHIYIYIHTHTHTHIYINIGAAPGPFYTLHFTFFEKIFHENTTIFSNFNDETWKSTPTAGSKKGIN